jgi:ATP-dependent Lon protease
MPIIRSSDSKNKSKPTKKDTKKRVKYESESDHSSDSDFYPDSEEESDYDEESDTEYEDEDEEEDDEDDFVTLSDSDSERSQEDEEDDLDNTFITDEYADEKSEQPDHKTIRKTIAKIFPSRYMKNKVKEDEKEEKEYAKKNKSEKSNKKTSKSNSKEVDKSSKSKTKEQKKKEQQKLEREYHEYFEDEDDDYFQEDTKKKQGKNINIIFGFGGDDDYMDEDRFVEDENEECDSDDEKTFMKETYEDVDVPKHVDEKKGKKSKRVLNASMSSECSKKSIDSQEEILQSSKRFENEYRDLVDMKKYLAGRLKANPNSKMIIKSLRDCKDSIKKLVKKARGKNTKEYHKMITGTDRKFTSEIEYFKKKLSNTEQLKIMGDLKEINNFIQIDKPYRLSLLESKIPMHYKSTILQKLNILRTMEPGDPEYYKLKNWIDTFMRIPIGIYRSLDIKMSDGPEVCQEFMEKSIKILDDCVYGMTDAKMQILQMVGQWIANPNAMGTAIAIKGPPGTGKTSLVKEGISKILGREFAFIPLGGAGDASFLEGHSYTYEGSSWGKILQILIDSKCMNPVIYFDELDKLSDTPRGSEITGILTHLTDTSQNSEFHDKYFSEMGFDLSKCLFIFSYNDENKVNPILRDRMYRIQTKGYNTKEKIIITKNYMLPKIREQVNFSTEDINIPDDTIEYIITKFTKGEDGVRNLKRCMEIIYTKLNLFRLVKSDSELLSKEINIKVQFPFTVTKKDVDILVKDDEAMNQSFLAMYT